MLRIKLLTSVAFLLLIVFIPREVKSQCNTNTSICTPGTSGPFGFNTPGTPVSTCLDFFGPSVSYISLYITSSGSLELLIDGDASTGFLDVAIFDVPPGVSPCVAITNNANEIGCNYASSSSGCNQFGTSFGCPSWVPAPIVNAGDELMIVVENWSGASFSFNLSLSPAGAQTGPPDATIVTPPVLLTTDAPFGVTAVNSGGNWSATCGPCIDPVTGVFDPAIAGIGIHSVCHDIGAVPCNSQDCEDIIVGSLLGVDLEDIEFSCDGNDVRLHWMTNSELNCEKYQIQKSSDGLNFTTVGEIKGNATSSDAHSYFFEEEYVRGDDYYRLMQFDFDGIVRNLGSYHTSCKPVGFEIFPNPNNGSFTLEYSEFNIINTNVFILDYLGRNLMQFRADESGTDHVTMTHLDQGIYTIIVTDGVKRKQKSFSKI
ncbi:MAG: T9SS type A sorting domain-containing protein [Crocinitomicaceae bacterium]|nr:T9SS type A sorting domain-containing protein [Crocinitomicaceae bacterium]